MIFTPYLPVKVLPITPRPQPTSKIFLSQLLQVKNPVVGEILYLYPHAQAEDLTGYQYRTRLPFFNISIKMGSRNGQD